MDQLINAPTRLVWFLCASVMEAPILAIIIIFSITALFYGILFVLAPRPHRTLEWEKMYITTSPDGKTTRQLRLPCWHDVWVANRKAEKNGESLDGGSGDIEEAEVLVSVVIPAYNEEERLENMLVEALKYLDAKFGRTSKNALGGMGNGQSTETNGGISRKRRARTAEANTKPSGYEIILVDDGSKDRTVDVALQFSQKNQLHDIMRIIQMCENRGKGRAVTHGFRHVRGQYAIFADADGASRFSDLEKLIEGCEEVCDRSGRGIAVGSRAHMVGTEAVVKRSIIRNALMHSFHLLLRVMTPPATSRIKDTQCGFKLFSRASLPYIIPYMHAEGWIFDVEMLMLAESAPSANTAKTNRGIKVKEVPIGWQEVGGSKLNVVRDSFGMAWSLFLLRASWVFGVYKRR